MEIRSQEGEMPIPLNTSYGGVHAHHHQHHHGLIIHHDHPSATDAAAATGPLIPTSAGGGGGGQSLDVAEAPVAPFKKMIKYRECLKNHAAAMGANATDGCGEFMPSGDDGTLEALTCSACGCHRNFHRKEIEGEPPSSCDNCFHPRMGGAGRKLFLGGHHKPYLTPPPPEAIGYHHHHQLIPPRAAVAPHQMIMSYNMGPGSLPSESDDQDDGGGGGSFRQPQTAKKRFRTKFTQEQKEKMLQFAEKVGWKIQKQEEGVVQQFCQEVGVKRRVLKVWMHNNKHNLGKKNNLNNNNNNNNTSRDLLDPSISIN